MTVKKEIVNGTEVLTIQLPLIRKLSKSGDNIVIASTLGNKVSTLIIDGKPVVVGVNAYYAAK